MPSALQRVQSDIPNFVAQCTGQDIIDRLRNINRAAEIYFMGGGCRFIIHGSFNVDYKFLWQSSDEINDVKCHEDNYSVINNLMKYWYDSEPAVEQGASLS